MLGSRPSLVKSLCSSIGCQGTAPCGDKGSWTLIYTLPLWSKVGEEHMAGGHGPHLSLPEVTWDISAHISWVKAYNEAEHTKEEWKMRSCSQGEGNWNEFHHPLITSYSMDLSVKHASKKHGQTLPILVQARYSG